MPSNGYRRRAMSRQTMPIPSVGRIMGQGGDTQGNPGEPPDIPTIMRQGKGKQGGGPIPSVQKTMRQGGGDVR